MAGEVIPFSDLFDLSSTWSDEMSVLIVRNVPVKLLKDSKSLFNFTSKGSLTSEKRVMLDIAAVGKDSVTILYLTQSNLADGLTKPI